MPLTPLNARWPGSESPVNPMPPTPQMAQPHQLTPLLTTPEVAKHFRKSVGTITRWVRCGLIRPMMVTKPYLFPLSEIERREKQLKPFDAFL